MQEETKEEFLSRLRKERGLESIEDIDDEEQVHSSKSFKAKLKSLFFLLLLALFLWAILQIFGMLKSN